VCGTWHHPITVSQLSLKEAKNITGLRQGTVKEPWQSNFTPSENQTHLNKCTKQTFAELKAAAVQYLDACPVEVIQRFINQTWRFMSAYRRGLTGKAAEWAVRKQKAHCAISNSALMALDAVCNPTCN